MKAVSTKTQRIIMYIPYVNFFNLFIALINIGKITLTPIERIKAFAYFFGSTLPIMFFYLIINILFPVLEPLCYIIAVYGVPVSMSYWLIRFQEKYCFNKKE